jgi:hypothetical protein
MVIKPKYARIINRELFKADLFLTLLTLSYLCSSSFGQTKTENFTFEFEGNKRIGIIDFPTAKEPTAMIVIVPGDGQTCLDFGLIKDLRSHFVQMGLTCCVWDKAGCGKSEGMYDDQQTIQNSAQEFITGIAELKHQNMPGKNRLGLWGISRAGWICPLILKENKSIAFWISVSGVDG